MKGSLCALALIALCGPIVCAADRVEKSTVLSVDLARSIITDVTREEDSGLLKVNTFTIRRNESTSVEIARQNPLLFSYEATNVKTDTAEYKAALEFAKQLQALLALFPASLASGEKRSTIRGIDPAGLAQDLRTVQRLIDGLGANLAASLGTPQQIADLKDFWTKENVEALARRIEAGDAVMTRIISDCTQADATLQTDAGRSVICDGPATLSLNEEFTRQIQQREALLNDVDRIERDIAMATETRATRVGELAAVKGKDKAKQTALEKELATLDIQLKTLAALRDTREAEAAKLRRDVQEKLSRPEARPTLREVAISFSALRSGVKDQLVIVRSFSADVAQLNSPLPLITTAHSLQRQTITVAVKASSKYEAFIEPDTRKQRAAMLREFSIVLEPYQPAHLSIAPAFVLGFVKNPEFTAVKDGDTYRIQKKEEDLTRYTLGIMLNITPDAWQEPTFGGHFQVGLSPIKDSLGFYFGAGIRAQSVFSFGGGFMLQQVRRLGGGLTLDSRLTDPVELKTEREFKPGLYLHATVEIPK